MQLFSDLETAWQLLIRSYRLSGEAEEALLHAEAWLQEQEAGSRSDTVHRWIEILAKIQKGPDPKILNEFLTSVADSN